MSKSKLFEQLMAEIEIALQNVENGFRVLGDILLRAQEAGMAVLEYKALEQKMLSRGLKPGDLAAMQAIASGKLDKRLYFCGVRHSLLMSLPMSVQQQLFTPLQFDLRTGTDDHVKKTWFEMEDFERTRLLGRGKKIHSWREQADPDGELPPETTWIFGSAKYEESQLLMAGRSQAGKISRQAISTTLFKKGTLEKFISDLQSDLAALSKSVKKAA